MSVAVCGQTVGIERGQEGGVELIRSDLHFSVFRSNDRDLAGHPFRQNEGLAGGIGNRLHQLLDVHLLEVDAVLCVLADFFAAGQDATALLDHRSYTGASFGPRRRRGWGAPWPGARSAGLGRGEPGGPGATPRGTGRARGGGGGAWRTVPRGRAHPVRRGGSAIGGGGGRARG